MLASPRRCLVLLSLALLAHAAGASAARAQVAPEERAAVLVETAAELEAAGETAAAIVLLRYVTVRYSGTLAAGRAADRLSVLLAARVPADAPGDTEILVWSTLYGLWLGVAVPGALGAEHPEPYGLGLLLGGPAGFLAGRAYVRSADPGLGQARAITFGGTWGTWQGFGWREVFDIGTRTECLNGGDFCVTETPAEAVFTGLIVGGLAGLGAGALIAGRADVTPGTATAVNFGALWGSGFAFSAGFLADLEDDDLLATVLVGGNAGLLAMALLAPRWQVDRRRARMVNLAGVVGVLAGLGIDLMAQPESDKVLVSIPTVTGLAGLAAGARWTRTPGPADGTVPADGPPPDGSGALLNWTRQGMELGVPMPSAWFERPPPAYPAGASSRAFLRVDLLRAGF